MLGKTLRRFKARPVGETPVFLIAAERHAARVREEVAHFDLAGGGAIFEPVGRNTAAAVAVATLHTLARFGNELVLVVPSGHDITTDAVFWQTIEQGVPAACEGRLVVFGVKPTQPETGYGYIEVGEGPAGEVAAVTRFVEKPDHTTAET